MKTAIFMRGHARTFRLNVRHNLDIFRHIYGDVDYFVAMPRTSTIDEIGILECMRGETVVACMLLDERQYVERNDHHDLENWSYKHDAYWKPAWLDYHLGFAKRTHELESRIRYDNVLFVRPDCWYMYPDAAIHKLQRKLSMMGVSEIGSYTNMPYGDWYSGDLIWRAGSTAADLLCMRWFDTYLTDSLDGRQLIHGLSHTLLSYYLARSFIGSDQDCSGFASMLVRPDHDVSTRLTMDDYDPGFNDSRTWHHRPHGEKIDLCRRNNIDPADYQLS